MKAPEHPDESERVAALHRLGILDQPPQPDFDALTRLARFVTGASVGIINLIDRDRQWQASMSGGQRGEMRREDSFCQVTVAQDRIITVADARLDERFADSPCTTGVLDSIRMYASVPVHDHAGYPVGTICVTDNEPRQLREEQVQALADLAGQVEHLFELRRQHGQLVSVLAEVDHHSRHDPLTGLANRRMLLDRLDHALLRARRTGVAPLVLFCGLDGFKAVNDRYGHECGDVVLSEVAVRLRACVRPSDTVARLGGDGFVVLCEDLDPVHEPVIAARIRSTVAAALTVGDVQVRIGTSLGAVRPDPQQDPNEVLCAADRVMYADKARRRTSSS